MSCESPLVVVAEAESAVFELRMEDARAALDRAEASFGCAAVEPAVLARYFDAEGALKVLASDPEGAAAHFRAARALAPGPDPTYGSRVREASDAAGPPGAPVALDVAPRPLHDELRVDAVAATAPLEVPAGLHLVQVGPPGAVAFGEIVRAELGTPLVVHTGRVELAPPPAPPEPVPPLPPEPPRRSARGPLLATAGGLATLGAVSAGLSVRARGQLAEAPDRGAVESAWQSQQAFGWTAYGLWGAAAGAAAVGLLVP